MPTASGAETIAERLTRLRADLARVRAARARAENNGQANAMGGAAITEISYERFDTRETTLTAQISSLEARLDGNGSRPGLAVTVTKMTDC